MSTKLQVCVLFLNAEACAFLCCTSLKRCVYVFPTTGRSLLPGRCRNSPPSCLTTTWAFTFTPVPRCGIRYALSAAHFSCFSTLYEQHLHINSSDAVMLSQQPNSKKVQLNCIPTCLILFHIFYIVLHFNILKLLVTERAVAKLDGPSVSGTTTKFVFHLSVLKF